MRAHSENVLVFLALDPLTPVAISASYLPEGEGGTENGDQQRDDPDEELRRLHATCSLAQVAAAPRARVELAASASTAPCRAGLAKGAYRRGKRKPPRPFERPGGVAPEVSPMHVHRMQPARVPPPPAPRGVMPALDVAQAT